MSEPKPLASLSPSLLARKGGAKPAMRPQLAAVAMVQAEHHDDLGWNDMGHASFVQPIPVQAVPEVVQQQQALASRIGAQRRSALAEGRRAAFTLRVDAERHLKLRLACTLRNLSAQQLVTQALDRLIDELPDVADLAAQVTKRARK